MLKDKLWSIEVIEGVVHAKYNLDKLDESNLKESILERKKLTKEKALPSIVDISCLKSITRDARIHMSSKAASEGLTASAVIVSNGFTTALANFCIKVNFLKPLIPLKLFTERKEALSWLEEYKK